MQQRHNFLLPLLFAIVLATGMFIGSRMKSGKSDDGFLKGKDKFSEVLHHIQNSYVDTVDMERLMEESLTQMLMSLDPHSSYISARELVEINQDLGGDFEGIGVEFNLLNDTIIVVTPIAGGPSEMLGIKAGDKIIYIDEELVAGQGITNAGVRKRLLGKKGTNVTIKVLRKDVKELIEFTITRDKIPLTSIDASYMIDHKTAYIKINRFSAKTPTEFKKALFEMIKGGMTQLILDLSGNPGGYLDGAIEISNHFFDTKKLLVYTEGRQRSRKDYFSNNTAMFPEGRLIIIIDEGSASASEIIAGAIQDYDRGIVLGRRSFGKGLVQEPIMLSDQSAIRLTVSRYYTPSGRYIQKPYDKGIDNYLSEMYNRYLHGEFYVADSIVHPDSLKFYTQNGRIVHGGGAIMPDVFIAFDTNYNSLLLGELIRKGIFNTFTISYIDANRKELTKNFPDFNSFEKDFRVERIFTDFLNYARSNGISINTQQLNKSREVIMNNINAIIVRQLYGDNAFYVILSNYNNSYKKAYEIINSTKYDELLKAGKSF